MKGKHDCAKIVRKEADPSIEFDADEQILIHQYKEQLQKMKEKRDCAKLSSCGKR